MMSFIAKLASIQGQGEMIWTLESLDMSNGTQWMWRVGRMILDEGSARSLGLAVE